MTISLSAQAPETLLGQVTYTLDSNPSIASIKGDSPTLERIIAVLMRSILGLLSVSAASWQAHPIIRIRERMTKNTHPARRLNP